MSNHRFAQPPREPDPPKWDERAPLSNIQHVDIGRGGVQFRGQRSLMLNEDAVTVSFAQLFSIMGTLLGLMSGDSEPGRALRAHIGGVPLPPPPEKK